jgi:hypothetical protein
MAARVKKSKDEVSQIGVTPAAVKAVAPKAPSLDDLLGDSVSTSPKKKSGTPDIRLVGTEVEEAVANYVQALSDKADAEAAMADAFAIVAPLAEEKRVELSRATKAYQSSVRVNARLTYLGSSQFCKVKLPEAQVQYDGLREVFGGRFETYFGTGYALKVKGEAISPELVGALKEACAKIGKNFAEVFDTEKVMTCAKTLHVDRILLPDVAALFAQAEEKGCIKPYKSTLKE